MQFSLEEKIFAMVGSNLNEFGFFFNHGTIVGPGSNLRRVPSPSFAPFLVALFSITYYLIGGGIFQLILLFFVGLFGFFFPFPTRLGIIAKASQPL
jgi:hypothetical protein